MRGAWVLAFVVLLALPLTSAVICWGDDPLVSGDAPELCEPSDGVCDSGCVICALDSAGCSSGSPSCNGCNGIVKGGTEGLAWSQKTVTDIGTRTCATSQCNTGEACVSKGVSQTITTHSYDLISLSSLPSGCSTQCDSCEGGPEDPWFCRDGCTPCTAWEYDYDKTFVRSAHWLCEQPTGYSGSISQPGLYLCDSSKVGSTFFADGGPTYCCTDKGASSTPRYQWGSCAGGGSGGKYQAGTDGTAWTVSASTGLLSATRTKVETYSNTCPGSGGDTYDYCHYASGSSNCAEVGSFAGDGSGLCAEVTAGDAESVLVKCSSANLGKAVVVSDFEFCCVEDSSTCQPTFVSGSCQFASECTENPDGTYDCSCGCPAGETKTYYDFGTSWETSTTTEHAKCCPTDQCNWAGDFCRQPGYTNGVAACGTDGTVAGRYLCSSTKEGSIVPGTNLCCYNDGGDYKLSSNQAIREANCCVPSPGQSSGETSCSDTTDNDCDGLVDDADPDCAPGTETNCNDSIDNDGDGQTDCEDADCSADPACGGEACVPGLVNECAFQQADCSFTFQSWRCNDGNSCTTDSCGSGGWCSNSPASDGTVCSGGVCVSGECTDCDQDGDGLNRMDVPACPAPADCNDNNANKRDSEFSCTDGWDNNCNGEADYDGFTSDNVPANEGSTLHGDAACRVGVTSADASPGIVNTVTACSGKIEVSCTSTVAGVRSVELDFPTSCTFTGWNGADAEFECDVPSTDGLHQARCYVNTAESYALAGSEEATDTVNVQCRTTIEGLVTDRNTGMPVDGATQDAFVRVNGVSGYESLTDSVGKYSIGNVPLGTYSLTAGADGYYDTEQDNVAVQSSPDPLKIDFEISPEECTAQCSLGGVCDYRCLGQNECGLDGFSPSEQAKIKDLCTGVDAGDSRGLNSTHSVVCCSGPIESSTNTHTPLTVESCAERLVPRTRLVQHNGRIYRLVVLSYEQCE